MRRFPLSLLLAALLGLPLAHAAHASEFDKVNGDVHVASGITVDEASTVNGDVHVASQATVGEASTVNGSIELDDKAQAKTLGSVNGSIRIGAGSRVGGDVETVNGDIALANAVEVAGQVENVNGAITLDAAHVAGGIETVSGDIHVGANSRVEGGILVDKPHISWFHSGRVRTPEVVIGPHAVVQGTLEFRRKVVLKVSDSAQIGPVKGATVVKFSGATP